MKILQRLILSQEVSERVSAKLQRDRWKHGVSHKAHQPETASMSEGSHEAHSEAMDGQLVILWRSRDHDLLEPRRVI